MDKIKKMLEDLEKELRQNKQYSAADKLLPIIEEAKKEQFTDYHGVVEQLEEYINESNNIDYNRALVEAIEVIEKRTYLNDGWLPCSERFPKEKRVGDKFEPSDEVLIYMYYGDGCVSNGCAVSRYWSHSRCFDNPWIDAKCSKENIIAWRELPEPYKGE